MYYDPRCQTMRLAVNEFMKSYEGTDEDLHATFFALSLFVTRHYPSCERCATFATLQNFKRLEERQSED